MDAFDKLAVFVTVLNAVSGGTLLPVVAGLWVFVIGCALVVLSQARGGSRG